MSNLARHHPCGNGNSCHTKNCALNVLQVYKQETWILRHPVISFQYTRMKIDNFENTNLTWTILPIDQKEYFLCEGSQLSLSRGKALDCRSLGDRFEPWPMSGMTVITHRSFLDDWLAQFRLTTVHKGGLK
jgi:hypothetical protein